MPFVSVFVVHERRQVGKNDEVTFHALPACAAWRHQGLREGFESVFLRSEETGYRFDGTTAAIENGQVWAVRYSIALDERWITTSAQVWSWSASGEREIRLESDGLGHWKLDGSRVPDVDGCLDVDLESSAFTNSFPVHRVKAAVGQSFAAPAVYIRALDLHVERLEQSYMRIDDDDGRRRYNYQSPEFGFECRLVYDASGLVVDYPSIATRVQ